LSRNFYWNPGTAEFTKATIAYGMAMAPGLLELAAMSFKKLLETTTSTTNTVTEADMFFRGTGHNKDKVCTWVPPKECTPSFQYEGLAYFGCTKSGSKTGWCSVDLNYVGHWRPCKVECRKEWAETANTAVAETAHADPFHHYGGIDGSATMDISKRCFWSRAEQCVPEFAYKKFSYFGCVTNPVDKSKAWCSKDTEFMGRWDHCHWTCPHTFVVPDKEDTQSDTNSHGSRDDPYKAIKTTTTRTTTEEAKKPKTTTTKKEKRATTTQKEKKAKSDSAGDTQGEKSAKSDPTYEATTTPAPSATQAEDVKTVKWQCHHYDLEKKTDGEWDKWCKTNPVEGDRQYKWFEDAEKSPCDGCWCCKRDLKEARRLEGAAGQESKVEAEEEEHRQRERAHWSEESKADEGEHPESSSFMIHFHPDAVLYKIDEQLVQSLIDRGAFSGLQDGREHHLGEASIVGFKIHHPETDRGETESKETAAPVGISALLAISGAALFLSLSAFRCGSRCRGGRTDYKQLGTESASTTA